MFERLKKIENLQPLRYESLEHTEDGWEYIRQADGSASYEDFKNIEWPETIDEEIYFYVPHSTGSDYSGCTVTYANHKYFIDTYEDCDWVHPVYGGYNTYAVAIGVKGLLDSEIFEEIIEILEGLEGYPLIDEDLLTEVEADLIEEAWDGWAKDDFVRALEKKFFFVDFDFPDDLREFFEEKKEVEWECEGYGPSMWIDVEDIVKEIEFDGVEKWATRYTVTWNDVGERTSRYYDLEIAEQRVIDLRERGFHATIT